MSKPRAPRSDFTLTHHRLKDFLYHGRRIHARCSCDWRDAQGQDSAYEARLVWQEHREAVGATR